MTADDGARGKSRTAVAVGNLLAFAFHPFEDGLLIAQREIDSLDPRVDDLDAQPLEQRLAIGTALLQLFANLTREVFEHSRLIRGRSGFGIIDSQQIAQFKLSDSRRHDRPQPAFEPRAAAS